MMELIDRQALLRDIPKTQTNVFENCRNCELLDEYQVTRIIYSQPIIEAEPIRRGYWIEIIPANIDHNITVQCSVCGAGDTHAEGVHVPYCWHCGAKMEEE